MSTDVTCFLFGVATIALWLVGIWKGVMPADKYALGFLGMNGFVRRPANPVSFWIAAALVGIFPLALVVVPVLSWLGLRG